MMLPDDIGLNSELNKELLNARFKSFSLEKFQDFLYINNDFEEFVRTSSRHFSLKLPAVINEFFISHKTAPYLWLTNHPSLIESEDRLKLDKGDSIQAAKFNSSLTEIKKFYANWILQKNEKEKQYFALSTINAIEKESANKDYLKNFLYSTLLAYEQSINSPEKSIQLLYKSKEIIDNNITINFELRADLNYLINLYLGFIFLKDDAVNEANQKFSEALEHKPNGISASFYYADTQLKLGNQGKAVENLAKILAFDKNRFEYAVKHNNIGLFNYFLTNAVSYNIFNNNDFAVLVNDLDFLLKTYLSPESTGLDKISNHIESFYDLPVKDFYDEEIDKNLKFIEKFIELYKDNKNFFLNYVNEYLAEKLNGILTKTAENIRKHYFDKAQEILVVYTDEIEKNQLTIKMLQRELDDTKLKAGKRLEEAIKFIEKESADNIAAIENKIEKMDGDSKFNPSAAFNSAMIYNIIISLIIFIIGGFGTGLTSSEANTDSFNSILMTIIVNGGKWGGITFIIGFIASLFTATSAIWERSNEKSRLIKQISVVSLYKEKDLEQVKNEHQKHIKTFEKNFGDRIRQLEDSIIRVSKEKDEKSKELYENANEKIKDITIYLESLKFIF